MIMNFVKLNLEHMKKGLKLLDAAILSVIETYNNNKMLCYCTNEQFANMFSVTEATVAKSLDRLKKSGYITKTTKVIRKEGKPFRRRTLTIIPNN